jgi:hypothetical protein
MSCRSIVGTVAVALSLGVVGVAVSAAASTPKSYKNCESLHEDYPHGVGRKNARDKTRSGRPVTDFKVSSEIYAYNDGKARRPGEKDLDRDNDGVACERR